MVHDARFAWSCFEGEGESGVVGSWGMPSIGREGETQDTAVTENPPADPRPHALN